MKAEMKEGGGLIRLLKVKLGQRQFENQVREISN